MGKRGSSVINIDARCVILNELRKSKIDGRDGIVGQLDYERVLTKKLFDDIFCDAFNFLSDKIIADRDE